MANKAEFQSSFAVVPMEERTPKDFEREMKRLWVKHFGPETSGSAFREGHLSYDENRHFIYAANTALADYGKMVPIKAVEDIEKPFKGISICTIGGVEGRVMAEMGARVVNIDPEIGDIPKLYLPNLTEIPGPFSEKLSQQYKGKFDMVLNSGLLDRGNSFVDQVPEQLLPQHCRDFLLLLLNVLKKGGLGVLRGGYVHLAVNQVASAIDSPDIIFIIQKK